MGDSMQRRRPPLRADREGRASPEPLYERYENDRQYEDNGKEEDSFLCILLDNCSLENDELSTEMGKIVNYFEHLSPSQMRTFLCTTFGMALEDRDFATKAGGLYGTMHTTKIGDDTVRSLLLSAIQKELEENNYQTGNRSRFLNAVFLLSEMYYHIRFDDQPITVLGGELIKYFRWLVTGDEKELEVLGICLIVNGDVIKKDKPATYRKLMVEVRVAWVTRNLSSLAKSWLLLIIDMDNANFKSLPEDLLICHMTFLGDEAFKKLKRVRPSCVPPSINKVASNNIRQTPPDKRPVIRSHSPVRVPSPDRNPSPEYRRPLQRRCSSDRRVSPSRQRSPDEWKSPERGDSSECLQSPEFSQYRYEPQKTNSKVSQRRSEPANRPQRPENFRGRPIQGSNSQRNNNDRWSDPPNSGHGNSRGDRRIRVWQHEHDDRFDRNYEN